MKKLLLLSICISLLFVTTISVSAEVVNDLKMKRFDQVPNHPPQVIFHGSPPVMGHSNFSPAPYVRYKEFAPPAPTMRMRKNFKGNKIQKKSWKKMRKAKKMGKNRPNHRPVMMKNDNPPARGKTSSFNGSVPVEDIFFMKSYSTLEKILLKMSKKAKKPAARKIVIENVSNLLKSSMLYRDGKTKEALKYINKKRNPKEVKAAATAQKNKKLNEKINSYKRKAMKIKKSIQAMKMEYNFYENELFNLEEKKMNLRDRKVDFQLEKLEKEKAAIFITLREVEIELEYVKGEMERSRETEKRASFRKKIFKLRTKRMKFEEKLRFVTVNLENKHFNERDNEEESLYSERNTLHEEILEIQDNIKHNTSVSKRKINSLRNKIKDLDYMIDRLRK